MSVPLPELSVVVVSLGDATALASMISALASEVDGAKVEVIVPAPPRVERLLQGVVPLPAWVRVVPLAEGDDDTWRMRARGAAAAQAPVIATLEDHALPTIGWASEVLHAHASAAHAAIGGVVEKSRPDGMAGWAMYFFDYARYIPPQEAGARRYLTACNVSYKRSALRDIASVWAVTMHETEVHFALVSRGHTLWLDPRLVVRQRRVISLGGGIRELGRHGRLYGSDVARTLTRTGRLLRIAGIPLVPVVHMARSLQHPLRSPEMRGGYLLALPALVAYSVAWALGEGAGLLRTGRAR